MRISTITNWAYGVTVLLTGLSGAAFLLSAHAAELERRAVEENLGFDVVAENLAIGMEKLTNEARLYAVRGAARHLAAYDHEADVERTLDRAIDDVAAMQAAPEERAAVAEADRNLGELNRIEQAGVKLAQAGDRAAAQALLYGPEHERAEAMVLSSLEQFRALAAARTETAKRQARLDADAASLVAKIMLALTAVVFLSVLYFVLRRRVSMPLTRMTGIVTRLARQDFEVEVPNDRRRDEIGDMTKAIRVFRENGLERNRLEAERRADQHAKDCILQMVHRLQACETFDEMADVIACFAPQTFPELAGRLYIMDAGRGALSEARSWLQPRHSADSFSPHACWGLRRGRQHVSHGRQEDVSCPHVSEPHVETLCVPLMAQGAAIGLLYFEDRREVDAPVPATRVYLELMCDNIALSLANMRLRERLASLAQRDGLTGLLNRRCLDEALARQGAKLDRPLACVMIDIDHFKRFNDEFGHDAGDAVMQHVAQVMLDFVGEDGGAYRFGGEEFTLLLPDTDAEAAYEQAERLRTRIRAAPLAHHGRILGNITVSLGLAVAPQDAPASTLLRRADAALLEAKATGRDRTVAAAQTTLRNRRTG